MNLNNIKSMLADKLDLWGQAIKTPRGSLIFLRIVIGVSFTPVVFAVAMWAYVFYTHDESEWAFKMINTALSIIDHIWTAQVVAGVMAYGAALVDKDGNGESDEWESATKTK